MSTSSLHSPNSLHVLTFDEETNQLSELGQGYELEGGKEVIAVKSVTSGTGFASTDEEGENETQEEEEDVRCTVVSRDPSGSYHAGLYTLPQSGAALSTVQTFEVSPTRKRNLSSSSAISTSSTPPLSLSASAVTGQTPLHTCLHLGSTLLTGSTSTAHVYDLSAETESQTIETSQVREVGKPKLNVGETNVA